MAAKHHTLDTFSCLGMISCIPHVCDTCKKDCTSDRSTNSLVVSGLCAKLCEYESVPQSTISAPPCILCEDANVDIREVFMNVLEQFSSYTGHMEAMEDVFSDCARCVHAVACLFKYKNAVVAYSASCQWASAIGGHMEQWQCPDIHGIKYVLHRAVDCKREINPVRARVRNKEVVLYVQHSTVPALTQFMQEVLSVIPNATGCVRVPMVLSLAPPFTPEAVLRLFDDYGLITSFHLELAFPQICGITARWPGQLLPFKLNSHREWVWIGIITQNNQWINKDWPHDIDTLSPETSAPDWLCAVLGKEISLCELITATHPTVNRVSKKTLTLQTTTRLDQIQPWQNIPHSWLLQTNKLDINIPLQRVMFINVEIKETVLAKFAEFIDWFEGMATSQVYDNTCGEISDMDMPRAVGALLRRIYFW